MTTPAETLDLDKFNPENVSNITGKYLRFDSSLIVHRTPLHVDFSSWSNSVPSVALNNSELNDPERFNAIGSANGYRVGLGSPHLPVIDVDGGARQAEVRNGSKVIVYPARLNKHYSPGSLLRDVLGDNGIDLEVFQESYPRNASVYQTVGSLVLRSKNDDLWAVDSTTEKHSHLYIQRPFSTVDHHALIDALAEVGIVSESWQKLTHQEGMSIVRTPWTLKDTSHMPS